MIYNSAYNATPVLAPIFEQCLRKMNLPETDSAGIMAPWWEDILIERVGSTDGGPLPKAYFDEYRRIFAILDGLCDDESVEAAAIGLAKQLLRRAMFAGAVAPRVSWHRASVVFFWTTGSKGSFFTIEADSFSYLEECEGEITKREDDFSPRIWDAIFPLVHGVH